MNWKFVQDTAYEINTSCSALQRVTVAWRDLDGTPHAKDPAEIVKGCRDLARYLIALGKKIEMTVEAQKKAEAA